MNLIRTYISNMNASITLVGLFYIAMMILTGCKVYYTTSEIHKSLQSTVDQVNSTLGQLTIQVNELEQQYNDIPCDKKSSAFATANNLMLELNNSVNNLNLLKKTVGNDYESFTQFTQGKNKIESGTEEWAKLKQTKAAMKTNLESIQNQGNELVSQAKAFNSFVNTSVIPTLQVCEVRLYTEQFEKAVALLATNLQTAKKDLTTFQNEVAKNAALYGDSEASTFSSIQTHIQSIRNTILKMTPIHQNAERILSEFKTKTSGIDRIYSCSANWEFISKTENDMNLQQRNFNALKTAVQLDSDEINKLIAGLNK